MTTQLLPAFGYANSKQNAARTDVAHSKMEDTSSIKPDMITNYKISSGDPAQTVVNQPHSTFSQDAHRNMQMTSDA